MSGLSHGNQPAWHKSKGFRRCSRCGGEIRLGQRYFGTAQKPTGILCFSCRTGHTIPVKFRMQEAGA
jgi:hypothetical protein